MNERRVIVVTLPDQADTVLHPRDRIDGGVEDDKIEPAEAVSLEDGLLLALLQARVSEKLNGFEAVDTLFVESLLKTMC